MIYYFKYLTEKKMLSIKKGDTNSHIPEITKIINSYFNVNVPVSKTYSYQLAYYVLLFQTKNMLTVDGIIGKRTLSRLEAYGGYKAPMSYPKGDQKGLISFYGDPNTIEQKLVMFNIPYKMKLAWDTNVNVNSTRVHPLCLPAFKRAFTDILEEYGRSEIRRLGLDLFGGVYNKRVKRGGSTWSTHAFGCAIDIDPAHNKFRSSWSNARFSKPEYKAFLEIMKRAGFKHLKTFDAMHFELTR
jgi:hypothetical protein